MSGLRVLAHCARAFAVLYRSRIASGAGAPTRRSCTTLVRSRRFALLRVAR